MNHILLPTGFHDLLPPDASAQSRTVEGLMKAFAAFGYEQVAPPLLEFEETLDAELGGALAKKMFRVMDPASNEMMALRADMTAQIARIATSRLGGHARPLRLSYTGQVVRVVGEGLHAMRQLTQTGIELIGAESVAADVEVVRVVAGALKKQGVKGLSVDFSLPLLGAIVMSEAELEAEERKRLHDAIAHKDVSQILRTDATIAKTLAALIQAAGPADKALESLNKIKLPKQARAHCERLSEVVSQLKQVAPALKITIDPLEHRGFNYHTALSFVFFGRGSMSELARGGRYVSGANASPFGDAVGCTVAIDAVMRTLSSPKTLPKLYVPAFLPDETLKNLQAERYITIQALEPKEDAATARKNAKKLGCTSIYNKSKIEPS